MRRQLAALAAASMLTAGLAPAQTEGAPDPAAPTADPVPAAGAPSPVTAIDRDGILAEHNRLRALHGVPPLAWSAALEQSAQSWINGCNFEHSQTDNGENLSSWSGAGFTQASRVTDWYSEIKDYDFAAGATKGGDIGHFTQIVWRGTTSVGCGVATCPGQIMMACQYAPAGNVDGGYQENVPPPR